MIVDRLPPRELRQALDDAIHGVSGARLRDAATRLSEAYRGEAAAGRSAIEWSELDYLAYAVTRMPATYQAALTVFGELRDRCPGLTVESMLDIGAGPATCLWAAGTMFPVLERATLVEPDPGMVALGQRLTEGAELDRRVQTTWQTVAIADQEITPSGHDVVVASYVLAELDTGLRTRLVEDAWRGAQGAVVFVEPGSSRGYAHIMEARDQLIALGARIVAPCPHADVCPLPDGDWCHFGVRLNRTAMQRRLKQAALAYEDEKYAYVIATRGEGAPAVSRVIRRPAVSPRRVTVRLCRPGGVDDETLTRGRHDAYRAARKLRWGDAWG